MRVPASMPADLAGDTVDDDDVVKLPAASPGDDTQPLPESPGAPTPYRRGAMVRRSEGARRPEGATSAHHGAVAEVLHDGGGIRRVDARRAAHTGMVGFIQELYSG